MVEGESGLLAIAPNSNRPIFEPSKRRVTWASGVQATLYASEEPERLRGVQHGAAWCDELAAWRNAQATFDNLQFGLRLGKKPRQVITTTPKPIKLIRDLIARNGRDVCVTKATTFDNRANLADSFFTQIINRYEGTRLGRQELNAELLEDAEGALWSRDLIEACRIEKSALAPLQRIVIAVDPSVGTGKDADECGLVVCGLGTDGRGFVLADGSGKMVPVDWARRAVALYRQWGADRIVAEANNGGALVEQTIRTVDGGVSYKSVHASRGKIARAEPISALFEQKRAHLVGTFPELEDQLCTFTPGSSGSPDRLDAMTWGLSELMLSSGSSAEAWITWAKSAAIAPPAPIYDAAPDPLPWRGGLGALSSRNELTRLYREAVAASGSRSLDDSPNVCSVCGAGIERFASKTTDGVFSRHFPDCPSTAALAN
jgi:phage terminase large subunit-like protein